MALDRILSPCHERGCQVTLEHHGTGHKDGPGVTVHHDRSSLMIPSLELEPQYEPMLRVMVAGWINGQHDLAEGREVVGWR